MKKPFPKRIVAFGSSSLEGKVDIQGGGFMQRLKTWAETIHVRNHVYNLGISAQNSNQILERLVIEAKPRQPDLILIYPGLNDTRREQNIKAPCLNSIDKFSSNFKKIIAQSQNLADVIVISAYPVIESNTTPLSWVDSYYLLKDAKLYTQKAKQICQKLNVPYIDVFNKWINTDYTQYIYSDGLHPNTKGHKFYFEQIKKQLLLKYKV